MSTTTYRAAYYLSGKSGSSAGIPLTGEEHAHLSDEDLRAEATRVALDTGLIGDDEHQVSAEDFSARLHIGEWTEA